MKFKYRILDLTLSFFKISSIILNMIKINNLKQYKYSLMDLNFIKSQLTFFILITIIKIRNI